MINLEKFRNLLEELFQLDQADLDFGIYRIMNTKREEIVRFLNTDLLPQVKEAFGKYKSADKSVMQAELARLEKSIRDAGMDPADSPKVTDLKKQIAESAVDVTALENEVFSHLTNFFRRYYDEGDFISQRRYKAGVYAIPYEGEEVKLHWANADQYYVKSSEYFKDYIFSMPSGKRVRVHLVAASTEQDNNKAAPGKERRFFLCDENPLYEENGELFIRFEYRAAEGKEKQDALNKAAIDRILKSKGFEEWMRELSKPAPTEKDARRTVLEKHLHQYTAKNTFDYFIHKDLGGFLRRELDFFIKNEIMYLDDVEHESAPKVEQYLSLIRVIRSIAHKVIAFLEQLENFQKKLWLKKKFVVETNYCITLDRVPEELYKEIAANDAQREEWVRLFAIDEIKQDLAHPGYSKPLTVDFLKATPHLVLDTAFFPANFKERLLRGIENLDEATDGLLIQGDNFHALSLLMPRCADSVESVFIDPPYNTGGDSFVYKDSYQHSSWLSMIADRLALSRPLLCNESLIAVTIDDNEQVRLQFAMDRTFGERAFVGNVIWQKKYAPANDAINLAVTHDYVLLYSPALSPQDGPTKSVLTRLPRSDEDQAYKNPDNDPRGPWKAGDYTSNKSADERPNLYYGIVNPNTEEEVFPSKDRVWAYTKERHEQNLADKRVWWGKDGRARVPAYKRFLNEVRDRAVSSIWEWEEVGHNDQAKKELKAMFPVGVKFETPKPVKLVTRTIQISPSQRKPSLVMDFFAGSGTTGQAVIELNRTSPHSRKYILVEMGAYFDSLLRERIAKAVFSSDWKDGKPGEGKGVSQLIKYIRIESYEDALTNLELKRSSQQGRFLEADADVREQYMLSYMLDVESRGSPSLLNIASFRNPDQYKLKVERNGETQLVNVDLVETFNWLLGLTVKHIDLIRGVRVVDGTNPKGERVLVLWRNADEMDNDKLDKWFEKQGYSTRDLEYDLIYVNGDNNLENLRRSDQTWKVRMIEEEFYRLMFDVQDV